MKTCRVCKEAKPLDEFSRHKGQRDGRSTICKVCDKARVAAYQRANREKRNAYMLGWRAAHPESHLGYYQRNKEVLLKARKKRREQGREVEFDRRYHEANREKRNAYSRAWNKANRERKTMMERKRQMMLADITADDVAFAKVLRRDVCGYCGISADSVDHIVPLIEGGSPHWDNLAAACRPCNMSKRTRSLLNFLLSQQRDT